MSGSTRSKLDVIVRRAGSYGEEFKREVMEIIADGARNGRFNHPGGERRKLEAAKKLYRWACLDVIRASEGNTEGLREALEEMQAQFVPEPVTGAGRYGKAFDVDFTSNLAEVRANVLEELEHGLIEMGKDQPTTTHIHQTGPNSVAFAAGGNSQVSVSVAYSHISDLIPAALAEARGYAIPNDARDNIIDHIQAIEDETKKTSPDDGRVKRFVKRLAADVGAAKDAAVAAGGAVLGTAAVEQLLAALSNV